MEKNGVDSTNKLLKVIVALLLRQNEEMSLREQIGILSSLALKPVEIAEILGRTNTYVNKELSGIRKNKKFNK